jgi:ubiquinone/menaquinone biosynthesis C-methylase UbiE
MTSELRRWLRTEGSEFCRDLGIKEGQSILDFGCGEGHYTIPVAKAVGQGGVVYALDKDSGELSRLAKAAKSEGIGNITPLDSSGGTAIGLEEDSIDVALLFDVLHYITADDRKSLYGEVHRVLLDDGRLLVYPKHVKSDHPLWNLRHMDLDELIEEIEIAGFSLEDKSPKRLLHDETCNEGTVLRFRKHRG